MATETHDDGTLLLEIFPNEVWSKILERVNYAQDYHQISSATAKFHTLLLPRAPQILFSEVIKVLLKHDQQRTNNWIVGREVCHAWKKVLDQVMQMEPYFTQDGSQRLSDLRGIVFDEQPRRVKYTQFISAAEFAKFEKLFDSTHLANNVNPFVQRKVELLIRDVGGEPFEAYLTACIQFLRKYGHHLWTCILTLNVHGTHNLLDFYNWRLNSILELMPNLRALQIAGRSISDHFINPVIPASLATLPNLEYVGINTSAYPTLATHLFVQKLLKRNPQVENVDVMNSPVSVHAFLEFLPNLHSLAFALWNSNQVREFKNAQFRGNRVERLWLNMALVSGNSEPVFRALERHFSETLTELHLRFPETERLTVQAELRLPNLRMLHLEIEKPLRLDFLLPMKYTLEQLCLVMCWNPFIPGNCHCCFSRQNARDVLQVYPFWKEPHKSNIWIMFPKLQVMEITMCKTRGESPENYRCTRKEWQAEMGAQNYDKEG